MSSGDPGARHERVGAIFLAAARRTGTEREAYLERACAGDAALRADVQRLLDHDDPSAPDDARHRLGIPAASDLLGADPEAAPGESVAGFELLEVLGHGSMGVVYLAQQEQPRRKVALKLLHPSLLGSSAARRFAREAEYLSRLEHPGIARVYGAGVHQGEAGARPYLVMELVHGLPLTDYAREARLDTMERLRLVRRVALAVQHAHERGVVHRDLKPANVLVTESGQPKLVDFGAAGLVDASLQTRSLLTTTGEWIGTLAYMSPEQWDASRHGVDERADVYALGVMLYELLAGRPPHDLATRSLPEALRVLAAEEPLPLGRVDRRLAGELETLVSTAMARDRRARYGSAGELADDLKRYLDGQPLAARPPSFTQVMQRRIRRHPVTSVVVAGLLLALTVFALQQRAHGRAIQRELDHTQQVNELVARFVKSKPDRAFASEESVIEMLARADAFVTEAAVPPAIEGGFRVLVGNAYRARSADEPAAAQAHLERGLALLDGSLGPLDRRSLEALLDLATLQLERGAADAAERSLDLLEARLARVPGSGAARLRAVHRRGMLAELRGDHAALRAACERVAAEGRDLLPADDRAYREAVLRLAELDLGTGGLQRAAEYLERCVAELGAAHPVTLGTRHAWSNAVRAAGHARGDPALLAEALALLEHNSRVAEEALGRCAPRAVEAWMETAAMLAELGESARAEELLRGQLADCPVTQESTRLSALRHWQLGKLLLDRHEVDLAAEQLQISHAQLPERPQDDPRLYVVVSIDLARALRAQDRIDEGLEHLRTAHAVAAQLEGADARSTLRAARMIERFEEQRAEREAAPGDEAAALDS